MPELQLESPVRERRQLTRTGVAEEVLNHYDFDHVVRIHVQQSRRGLSFRVVATAAGETKNYFLRATVDDIHTAMATRSELHWLQALRAEAKLTVPEPIPRRDGELLTSVTAADDRVWHYVLFGWLPGTHLTTAAITAEQCAKLGEVLARIHDHGEGFDVPDWFVRPVIDCSKLIGDGDFLLPSGGERFLVREDFRRLNKMADAVRDKWQQLGAARESYGYGLTHADFAFAENVLWNDGEFCPIDFTDSGWSFHYNDIATPLTLLAERRDFTAVREAFLSGYRKARPSFVAAADVLDVFLATRGLFAIRLLSRAGSGNVVLYKRLATLVSHILGSSKRLLTASSPRSREASENGALASLTTTRFLSRLRRTGVGITLDETRGRLRIRAQKGVLSEELRSELGRRKEEIMTYLRETKRIDADAQLVKVPRPADGRLPLSFAQERLFFIDQLTPNNPAYNIAAAFSMLGDFDVRHLAASITGIVRRHETLRTRFLVDDGLPFQVVDAEGKAGLSVVDLGGLPDTRREALARALLNREARRPFQLSRGHLLRALLVDLGGAERLLMISMHHIISDGWSLGTFSGELVDHYLAFLGTQPLHLAEIEFQYADYALWQRRQLTEKVLDTELDYWRRQLAGASGTLPLPTDRPRSQSPTYQGDVERAYLSEDAQHAIEELAKDHDLTLFMVMVAAMDVLLWRYTGQNDLLLGTPIAGRNRVELEDLMGFFVNTLVLRVGLEGDPTVAELLARVREVTLGAYAHQEVPFAKLVEELRPERDLSRTPLFQVLVTLDNTPTTLWQLPALTMRPLRLSRNTAKFDLSLSFSGNKLSLEYDQSLFDATTARRMLRHLVCVLEELPDEPARRLSRLEMLSARERFQLLAEWNDTAAVSPWTGTLAELFEEQAGRTPKACAVVFGEEHLSYEELSRRANRLAHRLRDLGVGPERVVGLCAERSPELVVGLLGILKAGGAYLPLDPAYPAERLVFMAKTAAIQVVLTVERLLAGLPSLARHVVCLDDEDAFAGYESGAPAPAAGVDNLAYVIYTSGSTGEPKGSMISHRGIVNRLGWMQALHPLGPGEGVLQKTPFTFDVSVWEFFWPLLFGGRLVLARPGGHQDSSYLARLVSERQVAVMHFVPSMLQVFLEEPRLRDCRSLRQVIASGEALSYALQERFYDRFSGMGVRLDNLYGPTEASVEVTYWRCRGREERRSVPIGRPISNLRTDVADRGLRPVPIGVAGELLLGGVGLARGYLGRPALTAERFVPDPCSGRAGERLYRTGDLARFRPDGLVEYLGRLDHQVKLRGFRVELGEVEAVLSRSAGVRECVVLARERRPGDLCLVAYTVAEEEAEERLRRELAARLPEYMVPSFDFLDALPLHPNGKVDRAALLRRPLPTSRRSHPEEPGVRQTPYEELMASIWADVLGVEVGREDNFFNLGGHSLLATQVLSRIRQSFGVEMTLQTLFAEPTVAGLSRCLEEASGSELPPVTPVSRDGDLPLSFAQERLWFLQRLEPESAAYNIPVTLRLRGSLDVSRLRASMNGIVRRHEVLRTTFADVDGRSAQLVAPPSELSLPVVDLTALDEKSRAAELRRLATWDATRPFDLAGGSPLIRMSLIRLAPEDHAAAFNIHHVVSDGWSMGILVRELISFYEGKTLPPLPVQYADFAVWQRRCLSGEILDRQLSWWKEQLAGAPQVLELPLDRARPAVFTERGAVQPVRLPAELSRRLESFSRQRGVTLFMTLLAAFQVLLSRLCGQDDVLVGSPIAGRNQAQTEDLIGLFVNTLVLRADLTGDPTAEGLLKQVRERTLGAYAHQDLPFERLVDELQPERDLSRSPLFQVLFAFQNAPLRTLQLPGLTLGLESREGGTSKFDLSLVLRSGEDGVQGMLEYCSDLFDATSVLRFGRGFATLLESLTRNPGGPLSALEILAPAERAQLLLEWSAAPPAGGDVDVPECLHLLFEARAARSPEAVALFSQEGHLTYAELDERASRLGRHLRSLGVGPEEVVGVAAERVPEVVVALLAVWKAGGVYLPLDPAHPEERIAFLLRDAGARIVLARRACRVGSLAAAHGAERVWLDDVPKAAAAPEPRSGPDQLAYVIYTSGSTGTPKGVAVSHRQAFGVLSWFERYFGLDEETRVLQNLSPCFDFGLFELVTTLNAGGTLCFLPETEQGDLARLAEAVTRHRLNTIHTTPSLVRELIAQELAPGSLGLVHLGGEALSRELVRQIAAALGDGCRIYNGYGPTEASINSTVFHARGRIPERGATVPIGRPSAGSQAYVLDRGGQAQLYGVPGELAVGGRGLARGYLRRPALTAERFVPHAFAESPGKRLYRTGDLVRWLPGGELEFLGRIDHQVKVRGFRIELGEVEAALVRSDLVAECVVLAREPSPGDLRLVAYVVANGGDPQAEAGDVHRAEALRAFLKERLAEHMVPTAFDFLDALPLNPNGKVDRKVLLRRPLPRGGRRPSEGAVTPPRDELELALLRIWEEILGCDGIGIRDSFFRRGGHSLSAVRLLTRVEQSFGRSLPLAGFFQDPTILGQAALLRAGAGEERARSLVAMETRGTGTPLFFVHPVGGNVFCYHELARELADQRPFYALQAVPSPAGEVTTMEVLAERYCEEARRAQPEGPYLLGGWSMGALVCFEMARQLRRQGQEVELVALLDPTPPQVATAEAEVDEASLLAAFGRDLAGLGHAEIVEDFAELGTASLLELLTAPDDRSAASGSGNVDLVLWRRLFNLYRANMATLRTYRPREYDGRVDLFLADPEETSGEKAVAQKLDGLRDWQALATGGLEIHRLSGGHYDILRQPLVSQVATRLSSRLRRHPKKP